jgi:iron complex transport system permease protein
MKNRVLTWKDVGKVCGLLAAGLLLLSLVAMTVGAVSIPMVEVFVALREAVAGSPPSLTTEHQMILLSIRLPRILLAMVVGATLAVAGAGYQALLRNPLADPYVLGVSSGAALGAVLSLALGWRWSGVATPTAAFVGALLTITVVYFLGQRPSAGGGELSPYTLLLAGVIMASFLSALITFLLNFLSGRDLRGATFWLMGDLSNPAPLPLLPVAVAALAVLGAVIFAAGDLNLLLAGEPEAAALGVNVQRTKLVVYLAASLGTGVAVSLSGAIGYVGLLVPHLVRLLFGSDYRLLLPATALGGSIVLVAADTLARTAIAPTELPVGAVTAVVGAPVFIYLLRRPQGQWFRREQSPPGESTHD